MFHEEISFNWNKTCYYCFIQRLHTIYLHEDTNSSFASCFPTNVCSSYVHLDACIFDKTCSVTNYLHVVWCKCDLYWPSDSDIRRVNHVQNYSPYRHMAVNVFQYLFSSSPPSLLSPPPIIFKNVDKTTIQIFPNVFCSEDVPANSLE